MTQLDLLTYPNSPGFKVPGTSQEAAEAVKPTAATLRAECLRALWMHAATADEVATYLGESVLSVRPRIAELHALRLIEKTGERRKNASGMSATVWRVKA